MEDNKTSLGTDPNDPINSVTGDTAKVDAEVVDSLALD